MALDREPTLTQGNIQGTPFHLLQKVAKLCNVYESLFSDKFDTRDALEDVKALRKILSTAPLQVPNETLVSHGKGISPNNAFEKATFLERRQDTIHLYDGKLYSTDQGWIRKMADAGLSYHTPSSL